jgi:hypothetical protein
MLNISLPAEESETAVRASLEKAKAEMAVPVFGMPDIILLFMISMARHPNRFHIPLVIDHEEVLFR